MLDIRFTLSALVLLPPALIAAVLVFRTGRLRGWDVRTLVPRLALTAYVTGLASVTLFPFQVVIGRFAPQGSWLNAVQFVPLVTADPRSFLLNVAMTVPLGILIPLLAPGTRMSAVARYGLLVGYLLRDHGRRTKNPVPRVPTSGQLRTFESVSETL